MTKIKTYVKKLELQEQETTDKIKQLLKEGQKQRACLFLKQKKFQQKEIEKATGATLMLQQTLNNIESAIADAEIFKALKQGDSVIKELQAQVSIDDWEALMDDHKENLAVQKREQELFGKVLEEEDLLSELEALEQLEADELANQIPDLGPQKAIHVEKQAQAEETKEAVKPKRQLIAA